MSKWLKAGRTSTILSCFGNSFSAEMRSSFQSKWVLYACLCPHIHSEYSLIFPFKAFPNNMTTFSCALGEPSVWRITAHRLSVSPNPIFHKTGSWLRQLLKVCWSFSSLSGLTAFWVRHSRQDPTLWAVLMTGSITRTISESLWCDRQGKNIIITDNEAVMGDRSKKLRSQTGGEGAGCGGTGYLPLRVLDLNNQSKHMSAHFAKDESIPLSWWQM